MAVALPSLGHCLRPARRHDQPYGQRRDGFGHHGGRCPNITKVSLELGGKAPAIVMADADMGLAVEAVKASRVINSGQVCNCAERVYVQRKVADEFVGQADRRDEGFPLRRPAGR